VTIGLNAALLRNCKDSKKLGGVKMDKINIFLRCLHCGKDMMFTVEKVYTKNQALKENRSSKIMEDHPDVKL